MDRVQAHGIQENARPCSNFKRQIRHRLRMSQTALLDVIILAAGLSRRMGDVRKQFQEVGGKPVYQQAIDSFAAHEMVGQIVLVVPANHLAEMKDRHKQDTLIIVAGGSERHFSTACGLAALAQSDAPFIAIHDAARPFVPPHIISNGIAALNEGAQCVIPVLPVADTIKQIAQDDETRIAKTLERSRLRRVQTPQLFDAATIKTLHDEADYEALAPTDDASLAEAAGIAIKTISGDEALTKLTWPSDLTQMKAANMTNNPPPHHYRTGTGFDVHRFKEGVGPIMICGVAVEHDKALDAHSDGDVGIHALCDAIFGALCDGDIGSHFPPSDPQWKDASSDQFLSYAVQRLTKAGGSLIHVDVTILCELPKIGPVRDAMREALANLCALPLSAVSVKATTTERLGFTGRGEGIAAQASATITLPI